MGSKVGQGVLFFCLHFAKKQVSARLLLIAIVLGGFATGCGKMTTDSVESEQEVVQAVRVATVKKETIARTLDYVGTVEPARQVEVVARIGATAVELYVDEGDEVEASTVLVRMESAVLDAQIERVGAEAERTRRESEFLCDLSERERRLFEAGAVAEVAALTSESKCDTSRRGWEASRAALEEVRQRRSYLEEASPLDGVVLHRSVESGEHVTPGRPLFTIGSEELDVRVMVTEGDLARGVDVGSSAVVTFGGERFSSEVVDVAPLARGPGRTVEVRLRLPTELTGKIRTGMSLDVRFVLEKSEEAIVVPADAMVETEEGAAVFVVDGERAHRTPVQVGMQTEDVVEILSGVSQGQEVVVIRPAMLHDGQGVYAVRER